MKILNHYILYLKLIQYCKSTIQQQQKILLWSDNILQRFQSLELLRLAL